MANGSTLVEPDIVTSCGCVCGGGVWERELA